jgi:hypothetical protein
MKIDANSPLPWQPFTPGGVAALASRQPNRLFRVQAVIALLVVGGVLWFLSSAWFPIIEEAAVELPPHAQIRARVLEWDGPAPVRLAGNSFLSITVDLSSNAGSHSTSDVQMELGREGVRLRSLFGYLEWRYPAGYRVELSRMEAQAWWGAWRQPLLAIIGALAWSGLFLSWAVVSLFYAPVAQLIGFYADRAGSFRTYQRLAAGALLPGSVVLAGGIILYGLQQIDLIGLLFTAALQIVISWVYLLISPFALPREPGCRRRRRGNPFRR